MASRLLRSSVRRFVVANRGMAIDAHGPSASAGEHAGGSKLWKYLTALVAIPAVMMCYANAFLMGSHEEERPEFIPYEHLRRRTKKFPWGDGNHTLFHNAHTNPLPDGYEDSH